MKAFLSGLKRRPILTLIIVLAALVLGISLPGAVAAMTALPAATISALANIGGGGIAGKVAFFTTATDIGSDPNFTWDNTNKRLGIGTATPSRQLHLKGNVSLFERNVNSAGFIIERNGADVSGYNRWVFGVDEPTGFVIKTYPYDGATAVEQLVITKDDQSTPYNESMVGIGTTSPIARLDAVETDEFGIAVAGENEGTSAYGYLGGGDGGVYGYSSAYRGVEGYSPSGTGVYGSSSSSSAYGVYGTNTSGWGVYGSSSSGTGVYGSSSSGYGLNGTSSSGYGVYGFSTNGWGAYGFSTNSIGVIGNGATYDFYANGPGTNYGPFTGSHEVKLAADFTKNIKPGLIVSVTGETQVRTDQSAITYSSTLPTVQLAATPSDKKVFGVLTAESPLPKDHWYQAKEGERFGIVNALGEGRVLVTDINGNIEAGDYITTSVIAGCGQRQADDLLHSYTLGKATENVDWSKVSETIELEGKIYKAYPIAVVYTSG